MVLQWQMQYWIFNTDNTWEFRVEISSGHIVVSDKSYTLGWGPIDDHFHARSTCLGPGLGHCPSLGPGPGLGNCLGLGHCLGPGHALANPGLPPNLGLDGPGTLMETNRKRTITLQEKVPTPALQDHRKLSYTSTWPTYLQSKSSCVPQASWMSYLDLGHQISP